MALRLRLTLVTNFEYEAKGRDYASEDLFLASALRSRGYQVATMHPNDLEERDIASADTVLWRNTGPVTTHKGSLGRWQQFQAEGRDEGKLANNLQLNGDLKGKQHLLDLTVSIHAWMHYYSMRACVRVCACVCYSEVLSSEFPWEYLLPFYFPLLLFPMRVIEINTIAIHVAFGSYARRFP